MNASRQDIRGIVLDYTITFVLRESETEKWKVRRFMSGMDAQLVRSC